MSLQSQPSPGDQRRTLIAVALITLVFIVWMWAAPSQTTAPSNTEEPVTDTSQARERVEDQAQEQEKLTRQQRRKQEGRQARQAAPDVPPDSTTAGTSSDGLPGAEISDAALAEAQQGTAREIVVETDLYEATFSTKGATLTSLTLKKYDTYDEETPVQLVDTASAGAVSLAFTTPQSHLVNTRALYFQPRSEAGARFTKDTLRVTEEGTELAFQAKLGGGTLRQVYVFHPERYEVSMRVEQENPRAFATADGYDLVWDGGLPYTEASPQTEAQNSGAFARSGGEVTGLYLQDENSQEKRLAGAVDWVATKNKYFTAALIPSSQTRGAELVGEKAAGTGAQWEDYTLRLQMPQPRSVARRQQQSDTFRLYLGPVDYYKLSAYDLDLYDMVDYGYDFFEWMTRPIAKYFFIPIFKWLHWLIPSYGIVIILLAIFVKMLVYPLTKSSYKSMAKMRELQPRMEEIREEYDDDQQKQQEEMMKMYKEEGANPIGGCLPMLLQYPIIITLYQFLPTAIDIRQQSFLWAHDLSVPDVILHLPVDIPFYGDYVAGFTILMGISMMISMSLQGGSGGGGQMKYMKYFMPIFIFVIFNRFAAGLSLYYLFYNIMTAAQQKYINHQLEQEKAQADGAGGNGAGTKDDIREARRRNRREKAKT